MLLSLTSLPATALFSHAYTQVAAQRHATPVLPVRLLRSADTAKRRHPTVDSVKTTETTGCGKRQPAASISSVCSLYGHLVCLLSPGPTSQRPATNSSNGSGGGIALISLCTKTASPAGLASNSEQRSAAASSVLSGAADLPRHAVTAAGT